MIDVSQASVQRAIDILRGGPIRASELARRMWPERARERTEGQNSQAGNAYLYRLAKVGYVMRTGDLWMIRTVGTGEFPDATGDRTGDPTGVGLPFGSPFGSSVGLPVEPAVGMPERLPNEPPRTEAELRAELERLHRLVRLADQPMATSRTTVRSATSPSGVNH